MHNGNTIRNNLHKNTQIVHDIKTKTRDITTGDDW